MTGLEHAKEVAEKLRKEAEASQAAKTAIVEKAVSELSAINDNPDLAKMYQESAEMGAKNVSAELPVLKVHTVGKSLNKLADGNKPNDGWFYYKLTQTQSQSVTAHILTISPGYRSAGMDDTKKTSVFNQILGGVMIVNGSLQPFIMYFNHKKLQNLWNFGKEISKYTKMRPIPIPIFALTIKLTTHQEPNGFGESWIVDFEVVKNEQGTPDLVIDVELFKTLRSSVISSEEMIAGLIDANSINESSDSETIHAGNGMPF